MALSITSGGFLLPPQWNGANVGYSATAVDLQIISAIDAAAEKNAFLGRVYWSGKPASKIISSAGGKIHLNTGALTFSSATSVLGIGIQSVTAGVAFVRPSGAFLVSASLTGSNPSPLASLTSNTIAMLSGAATITHGELYAVVADLSAIGAGDAINFRAVSSANVQRQFPMTMSFTTAWNTTLFQIPTIIFEADDGTLGWFSNSMPGIATVSSVSVSSGSAVDEWGMLFSFPFHAHVDQMEFFIRAPASTADAVVALYSNPKATPVTITAIVIDGSDGLGGANALYSFPLTNVATITSSTTYMMALRGTGATAISFQVAAINSSAHKNAWSFGEYFAVGNRASAGGSSFSVQQLSLLVGWGIRVNQISISAAASAGILVHPGMAGGYRG